MILSWKDDSRVENLSQVVIEHMGRLCEVRMDQESLVYKPSHRSYVYLAGSESEVLINIEAIGRFKAQVETCVIQKDQT
jgi:hypothetical protein